MFYLDNDGIFKLKKNKNSPTINSNKPNLVHNDKIGKFSIGAIKETLNSAFSSKLAGTIKKTLDNTFSSSFTHLDAKKICKTKNSIY